MHVFWFKDSVTGHLKQVDALLTQLQKEVQLSLSSINCDKKNNAVDILQSTLMRVDNENLPIVLIGAGHGVYPKIISSKIKRNVGFYI